MCVCAISVCYNFVVVEKLGAPKSSEMPQLESCTLNKVIGFRQDKVPNPMVSLHHLLFCSTMEAVLTTQQYLSYMLKQRHFLQLGSSYTTCIYNHSEKAEAGVDVHLVLSEAMHTPDTDPDLTET